VRFGRRFHCTFRKGAVILTAESPEEHVELFSFDEPYFLRLRAGDPLTERHFVAYFSELIQIKLRARYLGAEIVDELRQETFSRVLTALRAEGGIRQPERLGAFVNSVCNNVLLEHYRGSRRSLPLDETLSLPKDKVLDIEGLFATRETAEHVRIVLARLPDKDRRLLLAIFLEEKDKDEVCQEFGVNREYLRVLLHRAKARFRDYYDREQGLRQQGVTGAVTGDQRP
jgi:RNA polymerase sigma-70 factor (ECF subfamily)